MDVAHRMVDIGDVRLHCAEMGQGPLVLLLHGFPECWVTWRNQLPALAAAGFRAVAPDLRGYGGAGQPPGGARYPLTKPGPAVAGLIRALRRGRPAPIRRPRGGALPLPPAVG